MRTSLALLCFSSAAAAQTVECHVHTCQIRGHVDAAVLATLSKQPQREDLRVFMSHDSIDADLQALAKLTWLRGVAVYGHVTTLAPLAALKSLRQFVLGHKGITTTLAPLAGNTELEYVDLNEARVKDISALAKMTKITYLDLQYNDVTDVSVLAGMKALQTLNVSGVHATDWKALTGHAELKKLWLFGAPVGDVELIAASTELTELMACNAGFTHIRPLAGMTDLKQLDLEDNEKLSDLSPLSKLTSLTEVKVCHTAVKDLSPLLASAKSLENLRAPKSVKPASIEALKKLNPEIKLELCDD